MSDLDRQWAFDTALAGLRKQGRQSITEDRSQCLYRAPGGLRCGIGFLIPDKRYRPKFDKEGWGAIRRTVAFAVVGTRRFTNDDRAFLETLQAALHDELDERLSGLEKAAQAFAGQYHLTYTPLSTRKAQSTGGCHE